MGGQLLPVSVNFSTAGLRGEASMFIVESTRYGSNCNNNLINQLNDLANDDVTIIAVQSCSSPHCSKIQVYHS